MGGISLMDIVDKIVTVLAADAALTAWADAKYDKALTILVGMDERNRPGPESCPMILIRPESVSNGDEAMSYKVLIDWAVFDDAQATAGVVTEFTGVRRADEMGRLVCSAIESGMPGVLQVQASEYTLEAVERYPLILGGVDISFNVPVMLSGQLTL